MNGSMVSWGNGRSLPCSIDEPLFWMNQNARMNGYYINKEGGRKEGMKEELHLRQNLETVTWQVGNQQVRLNYIMAAFTTKVVMWRFLKIRVLQTIGFPIGKNLKQIITDFG